MKRRLLVAAAAVVLVTAASIADCNGPLTAVHPDVSVALQHSLEWIGPPTVMSKMGDADGVYLVVPEMPQRDQFNILRVSATTGAHTQLHAPIGPSTGFRDCLPVPEVRAVVHGLRFNRPAFHLFLFPSGQGPGFHRTDSATGRIDIVFDEANGNVRRLLTQRAYNSDRIVELLARVSVDRNRHWIAATNRQTDGGRLFVFRLR
jgi:hypothetical protein